MNEGSKRFKVHDDPGVRETYVNQMVSASFDGCSFMLTLGILRYLPDCVGEPSKPNFVLITDRLAITPAVAAEMVNSLQGLLALASRRPVAVPNQAAASLVGQGGQMNGS